MPVHIDIDPNKCGIRIMEAWSKGLGDLSAEILEDCNEYCKVDQHTLINSSYVHSVLDQGKLVWETPYAKRQYWEIKTALTPGTTWKWCETAKRKHLRQWTVQAEKALKGNL